MIPMIAEIVSGGPVFSDQNPPKWPSFSLSKTNKQGRSLDFLQGVRLREQTGEKLGYHTGGKTARTNRVEAGTSYREESCENKQGRGWYISRGIDLRRIPVRLDDLKSLRHSRCLAFPAF
jgi:hypothetical protein